MNKKFLMVIFGLVLVIGAGAVTFFIIDVLNDKPSSSLVTAPAEQDSDSDETPNDSMRQLRETQQDVTVKNLLSRVASGISNYQANNRGSFPRTDVQMNDLTDRYLENADLINPATNTPYEVLLNAEASSSVISFQPGYTCSVDDSSAPAVAGSSRQYAVSTVLPSDTFYCLSF